MIRNSAAHHLWISQNFQECCKKKEGTPAGPFPIKMQSVQSILTEVPLAVDVVEIELAKRSV